MLCARLCRESAYLIHPATNLTQIYSASLNITLYGPLERAKPLGQFLLRANKQLREISRTPFGIPQVCPHSHLQHYGGQYAPHNDYQGGTASVHQYQSQVRYASSSATSSSTQAVEDVSRQIEKVYNSLTSVEEWAEADPGML